MAKTCIQCGKKIGMFQKAIDGIYCSLECQGQAQMQIVETERKAAEARAEAQRQAEQAAEQAAVQQAADEAAAKLLRTCPKCGAAWQYAAGAGAGGLDAGRCDKCGFTAQFKRIDSCPSCSGETLVVAADDSGHCPRCYYRT